jgi:hypothetical protein
MRQRARRRHRKKAPLLTVPNQLGVDYNAHVVEAILKYVAPGLGRRRRVVPKRKADLWRNKMRGSGRVENTLTLSKGLKRPHPWLSH